MNRRDLVKGLFIAPAVITTAGLLMKVRPITPVFANDAERLQWMLTQGDVSGHTFDLTGKHEIDLMGRTISRCKFYRTDARDQTSFVSRSAEAAIKHCVCELKPLPGQWWIEPEKSCIPILPSFHFVVGRSEQCTAVSLPGFVSLNFSDTRYP